MFTASSIDVYPPPPSCTARIAPLVLHKQQMAQLSASVRTAESKYLIGLKASDGGSSGWRQDMNVDINGGEDGEEGDHGDDSQEELLGFASSSSSSSSAPSSSSSSASSSASYSQLPLSFCTRRA